MKFRALSALESELLETATLGNINWCEERFTLDDVRENELFAHYTRLQPNRGDFGIVAEDACIQTGVVWALFLPQSNPGFGFIDETTPELSL
ncbi:hypothetical protein CMUST_12645 [Corynebacterium mustelae]|uniref:Acetyltransferase (GNAT) domain n=1 Tax=Corynebacterium mustelae TaxID=571915 RepID=A0A0G3H098_9CORY|nr:hypothetical protein [Corynebacterium mustelae]AKK06834.1 hypothetical protein CMUST_12645 [Corynebacterium mustelae]